MRKVIACTFVTIDGYYAGPNGEMDWNFDYLDEEIKKEVLDQLKTFDTLILGAKTYQIFANAWPNAPADDPNCFHMNNTPKIVFSKRLKEAPRGRWNNATVFKEIIPEEIQKLKQQPGKDMAIIGSGSIVHAFTNLGLIDQYRLLIHPVVLSSGKPLFKDIKNRANLRLIEFKTLKSGVVGLYYETKHN